MSLGKYLTDLPITRSVPLTGSKVAIVVPDGCDYVNIKCASEITFYEEADSYVVDGITYGTGYSGTNMSFPVSSEKGFYLGGTGTATILFTGIQKV